MILPPKVIPPTGEPEFSLIKSVISALVADTFNGKIHIEWDRALTRATYQQGESPCRRMPVWRQLSCPV
jgi:hypothetical protein